MVLPSRRRLGEVYGKLREGRKCCLLTALSPQGLEEGSKPSGCSVNSHQMGRIELFPELTHILY